MSIRQKLASRADRTGLLTPRAAALATATPATTTRPTGRSGRAPAKRQGEVLRPGSAAAAAGTAVAADAVAEADVPAANGAARAASGATKRAASASGAKRPPPRPRKGKGKGKGGRRH